MIPSHLNVKKGTEHAPCPSASNTIEGVWQDSINSLHIYHVYFPFISGPLMPAYNMPLHANITAKNLWKEKHHPSCVWRVWRPLLKWFPSAEIKAGLQWYRNQLIVFIVVMQTPKEGARAHWISPNIGLCFVLGKVGWFFLVTNPRMKTVGWKWKGPGPFPSQSAYELKDLSN